MDDVDLLTLFQIAFVVVGLLVVPAYMIYALWKQKEENRFYWLMRALYTGALLLFLFLVAPWDWVSVYLRYVWIVAFLVVILASYRQVKATPLRVRGGTRTWSDLFTLLVFVALLAVSAKGYFYADEPVRLAFPLREGRYYVGQGGNSPLLNYHNTHSSQKYALDIVELNAAGARATGIYPSELNRYAIFGHTVHSPCDGTVTKAIDGLPDLAPPEADPDHPAGNHVVITCQGVNVVLAHLQNGSVTAQTGAAVQTGQPLGKVGNSGNTTEPHLHVHAVRTDAPDAIEGEGVPLLFSGSFLARNSILVR